MNSLKDKFIISMPTIKDCFSDKSNAYTPEYNIDSTTKLIINKRINTIRFKILSTTEFLKRYKLK